jgi:hypothetical protein
LANVPFEVVPSDRLERVVLWGPHFAAGALLLRGIDPLAHAFKRGLRLAAGLGRLERRIAADREPALATVETIKQAPALAAVLGHTQRQAWKGRIEIFDLSARWRLGSLHEKIGEFFRRHACLRGDAQVTLPSALP